MKTRIAILLLALSCCLALPSQAATVEVESTTQSISKTVGQDGFITSQATITATETREAYIKVLPNPNNPVYRQGTIGTNGWWANLLVGADNKGSINGWQEVNVGQVGPSNPLTVTVQIHVPGDAGTVGAEHNPAFVVALRSPPAQSNGAVRDPSTTLVVPIQMVAAPPPATTAPAGGGATTSPTTTSPTTTSPATTAAATTTPPTSAAIPTSAPDLTTAPPEPSATAEPTQGTQVIIPPATPGNEPGTNSDGTTDESSLNAAQSQANQPQVVRVGMNIPTPSGPATMLFVLLVGGTVLGVRLYGNRVRGAVHKEYRQMLTDLDQVVANVDDETLNQFFRSPSGLRYLKVVLEDDSEPFPEDEP